MSAESEPGAGRDFLGQASRTAAAAPAAEPKKTRKKWTRRTPVVPANGEARFGVFSDGTVQIDAAGCKGNLAPAEANALIEFLHKLKTTRA